ncbi:MAG: 2-dehydropantoate 2-reductase [Candidatus Omnitrophica bacterium]|nr:2-dehydropantoate 2-reductase [Candidatus Omnitrophota bacterium]
MKIAVIGAGAIGGLAAGYLKDKGEDVSLVGHTDSVKAIQAGGLRISGARGNLNIKIDIAERLHYKPDLVILATKTQDIEAALKENLDFISEAAIVTAQNGIQADQLVAKYVPEEKIISSIVMFGSTFLKPGEIVHNFEGSWILGRIFTGNDKKVIEVSEVLNKIFPAIVSDDIKGMKYLKIFVNANNCIPAILGKSMQESFSSVEVSRISIAIWKEGLDIVNKAGINLLSLPDFPLERLVKLTSLPAPEAAKIFSGIMANLSKEPLYGSVLQSIKRKKASEIDYLNGEFVRLAKENNLGAPLNEKLAGMVHQVEASGKFFTQEELLKNTESLLN